MLRQISTLALAIAMSSGVLSASSGEHLSVQTVSTAKLYQTIAQWNDVYKVSSDDRKKLMQASISLHHALLEPEYDKGYIVAKLTEAEVEKIRSFGLAVNKDTSWKDKVTHWVEINQIAQPKAANSDSIPGYSCYPTVEATLNFAQQATVDYPNLAALEDIGDSWTKTQNNGGYDLMVLKLTNKSISGEKPILFINSALHAREYATAPLNQSFAQMLLEGYGNDADITWILDHHDIRLLLQANPDGRKQAETGKLWRKNANSNYCSGDSIGADLNRNFSLRWGLDNSGSSPNECSSTYRGPTPASEPEVSAIEQYIRSIYEDKRGDSEQDAAPADTSGMHIDIHSYSRLMLWPWGHTSSPAPNGTQLEVLGRKIAYFNGYSPMQSVGLYPTNGTSDEISYGEMGIANMTFELGTSFFQPCSSYNSTVKPDNLNALLYAARVVKAPYMLPFGPDVSSFVINGDSDNIEVEKNDTADVVLTVSDARINNNEGGSVASQNIKQVVYYIDQTPWEAGAVATNFSAQDGDFNSDTETVVASIDTTNLSLGKHIIYTQSQDLDDNWGPVYAKYFEVVNPNVAPTASFTFSCAASGLCDFDASASSDSDGEIASYAWQFTQNATGEGVTASHQFADEGDYQVRLTVTDNNGASVSITQDVSITIVNTPPVADFTYSCNTLACEFDASNSTDSTGQITTYAWNIGDGNQSASTVFTHTYADFGNYDVTLTVTDQFGASHSKSVEISLENTAPEVSFDVSCQNLICSFDASASSDATGSIDSYDWNFGNGSTGTGTTMSHTYSSAGSYTVELTVTDEFGLSANKTSSITVTAAPEKKDSGGSMGLFVLIGLLGLIGIRHGYKAK